ncbi:phosphocarrier protein HPr [Rhodococcoides trifolii]|uniref:Phosphocarrier protein HPr n=1 Tax=Rhodococcoides trifolii TaxID=908250 RepID=A0A917FWP2_9NOCA|nr:HPr family phosphocarrier protein [Rhodococcus trifolii]GGG08170.1 phosphocarrier protein HPr [Rhodococcus trifolii]
MPSTTVTVGSAIGLHARPAAIIAEAVDAAGEEVTLEVEEDEEVDAGSALLIMTLGATKGTEVKVTAETQETLDKIAALVASDLDA